jgi:hypothetical protein
MGLKDVFPETSILPILYLSILFCENVICENKTVIKLIILIENKNLFNELFNLITSFSKSSFSVLITN